MAGPQTKAPDTKKELGAGLKVGLTLVVMLAMAGGYYLLGYSDLTKGIASQLQRTDQLKADEDAIQSAYKAYLADAQILEQKKLKAASFRSVLSESGDMINFLAAVNQQAEIAGLKVKIVAPTDEQPDQYYIRIPITLEVSGKFHQIIKFFAGISRLDRIINVENIQLGTPKAGESGDETILTTKCLATTFRAKPTPKAEPVPGGT